MGNKEITVLFTTCHQLADHYSSWGLNFPQLAKLKLKLMVLFLLLDVMYHDVTLSFHF